MRYSVTKIIEGIDIYVTHNVTLENALRVARAERKKGNDAYIMWFRISDQQHGYYNEGEGHAITGKTYR